MAKHHVACFLFVIKQHLPHEEALIPADTPI